MKKGYWITLFVCIVLLIIFFFMWRLTVADRNKVQEQLSEANGVIEVLKSDKNKLLDYLTERDTKIEELQKEYKEKLNNIPKDSCGDQKPSKELLDYLKRNEK